jgi:hypothetical protein
MGEPEPNIETPKPEPRWPAVISLLCVGALHYGLPANLRSGPEWLVEGLVILLLIPTVVSHRLAWHKANEFFGRAVLLILTIFTAVSVARLAVAVVTHRAVSAPRVLESAGILWISNVLIFAGWYWKLDAGGPNERARRGAHETDAFLFPQMTLSDAPNWTPKFVDYLFLAFNTSTALSPADTAVLGRWAKVAMMVQATISLVTIVVLAARAVNVL